MKTKATQRSLKSLRDNGWICAIVEKWIPPRGKMKFGIRQDVWNFGDILACRPAIWGAQCWKCIGVGKTKTSTGNFRSCMICNGHGKFLLGEAMIALVQCFPDSGGSGFAAHRRKILDECPEYKTWLAAGGKIFLQGWGYKGSKGHKKKWTLREEEL